MRDETGRDERSQAAILAEELQASIRRVEGREKTEARFASSVEEPSEKKWKEEKKRLSRTWMAGLGFALSLAVGGLYLYQAMGFQEAYLPHTRINGMDVTGKTVEEVKGLMSEGAGKYQMKLLLRGGEAEVLRGEDLRLDTVFDGSLEEIIKQQNPYAWPRYLLKGPSYELQTMITFDEEALEGALSKLKCFDSNLVEPPRDAYLSDYIRGQGYTIVPETEGNQLDPELVKEAVSHGMLRFAPELDLEELGCYKTAVVGRDNAALLSARDERNFYVNAAVTYTFGNQREVLDGERIHQWLVMEDGSVALNEGKVTEYVKELAKKYNTAYTKRFFTTSYGDKVEVSGFYGWRINETAEVQELIRSLKSGESVTREPIYLQTAASREGPDYGTTYAEVNLTAQHLFFYQNGRLVLESDFVSGNVSKGHTTPPGLFGLTYKQRDAVLKGENYRSPVKFWMPFNGGIGFHDASWRSSFGGSIYKTGGSHGCINLPYAAAKTLFEGVYPGMPVICYYLPGTERSNSSRSSGKAPSGGKVPSPTKAAPPSAVRPSAPSGTAVPASSGTAPSVLPPPSSAGTLSSEKSPEETLPSQGEVLIEPVDQGEAGVGPGFDPFASQEQTGTGLE